MVYSIVTLSVRLLKVVSLYVLSTFFFLFRHNCPPVKCQVGRYLSKIISLDPRAEQRVWVKLPGKVIMQGGIQGTSKVITHLTRLEVVL